MMATAAIQEAVVRSSSCIQDVKSLKGEQCLTTVLHVKVLDVGAPTLCTNTRIHVVTARIADESSYTDVHVYDSAKFPLFRVGEDIIVSRFAKKKNGSLIVTQTSNVRTTNKDMVTVPEEIVDLSKRTSKVKTGTPTTKRLQNTRKEVPSKRLKVKDDNEVIDLTSPSKESTSLKSQTKPSSSTLPVRLQQSVTIQRHNSTQQAASRQVHRFTAVTTTTSVPRLGCKSVPGSHIPTKPSGKTTTGQKKSTGPAHKPKTNVKQPQQLNPGNKTGKTTTVPKKSTGPAHKTKTYVKQPQQLIPGQKTGASQQSPDNVNESKNFQTFIEKFKDVNRGGHTEVSKPMDPPDAPPFVKGGDRTEISKPINLPDESPADSPQPSRSHTARDLNEAGTPNKKRLRKTEEEVPSKRPAIGVVDLTSLSTETATSVSTSRKSQTKPLSYASPVRPQQSVTIQPPTSDITLQGITQVHLSTATTVTSVPSLDCKSVSGSAIHTKPLGASQQPHGNVNKRKNIQALIEKNTDIKGGDRAEISKPINLPDESPADSPQPSRSHTARDLNEIMVNARNTSTKEGHRCPMCNARLMDESGWERHVMECGRKLRQKKFECTECDYGTNRKYDMERHRLARHSKVASLVDDSGTDDRGQLDPGNMSDVVGSTPRNRLADESCLGKPTQQLKGAKVKVTQIMVNTRNTPTKVGHRCPMCNARLMDEIEWERHVVECGRKRRQKKFECAECDYATNKKGDMEKHCLTRHSEVVSFVDNSSTDDWEHLDPGNLSDVVGSTPQNRPADEVFQKKPTQQQNNGKDMACTLTKQQLRNAGEEDASEKITTGLINLTSSPNETITTVPTSRKSETKDVKRGGRTEVSKPMHPPDALSFESPNDSSQFPQFQPTKDLDESGTPTKQQPKKTEVPIKGVVDLTSSSNETDTSVSPSQESHTKHLSSTNSVRPQQSVTIQPPTSAITQQGISRQVHLSTVVTTATSVPSLGFKSTSWPAIHPKPSGVSQQLPKSVGERNSAIIGQPTELSSNPTITSASTSQKSQSKRSSSPCPVLPQQSMTLQPHKLAIKQQGSARQVHFDTVVTTTTSVASLVRTSAPGFGIQSTPSGAPQKSPESFCERNSTILVQPTGLSSNETAIFVATSRESQSKSTETSKGLPQTCVGDQPVPKASEDKKGPKRDGSLASHPNYDGDRGANQGGVRGEHCANGGDQSDMSKEAAMQERLSVRKESPGGGSKQIQRSLFSAYPALGNKGEHPRNTPEKKPSASTFTKESLEKLNVLYNEKPTEMKDFFEMVKSKATEKITGANLEETMDTFKRITKEQLKTFSIDLDDLTETKNQNNHNTKSRKKEVMHHITASNDEIDVFFKKAVQKKEYKEPRIIRLLTHWKTAVTEFMQNCADVVHSILQPEILPRLFPSDNEVEESPGEILYHNLFMSFSRIFLLRPRQQRKVYNKIRKDIIACQSDMCFLQSLFSPCTDAPKLVMMCEVKRKEPFKHGRQKKSIWIEKKIDSNAMGQIGMELLSESTGSFFSPGVAGIACLRSEIMFLFLDISEDHIQALKEDDASLDGKDAKIYYTETYDILKPDDRIKFMDILLYFAAIQSGNFIYPL